MSIISDVSVYVQNTLSLPVIYLNQFPDSTSNENMFRDEPSQGNPLVYLNGDISDICNFAAYVKSKDMEYAQDLSQSIKNVLNFKQLTEISAGVFVKCEVFSNPVFIEKRENGDCVYAASYRLEYLIEGGAL